MTQFAQVGGVVWAETDLGTGLGGRREQHTGDFHDPGRQGFAGLAVKARVLGRPVLSREGLMGSGRYTLAADFPTHCTSENRFPGTPVNE